MKNIVNLLFLMSCLYASSVSALPWGKGCCCPSASGCVICGTVPCDSSCAGAAINELGTNVSSLLNQLNSLYDQRNVELQNATQEVVELNANTVQKLTEELYAPMQGNLYHLDAFKSRIVSEIQRSTKAFTNLSDTRLTEEVKAYKSHKMSEEKIYLEKTYGKEAQPMSGDVAVDKAIPLKRAEVNLRQLRRTLLGKIAEHNRESKAVEKGMKGRLDIEHANKPPEEYLSYPLNSVKQLTSEQYDHAIEHITLTTNRKPLPPISLKDIENAKAARYMTERNLWNSKIEIVQDALLTDVLKRTQLVEGNDWIYGYANEVTVGDNGATSIYDTYLAEIDGRLSTPGWFEHIKGLTKTGLDREEVYIDTISNRLAFELLQRKSTINNLLSIQTVTSMHSDAVKPTGGE